ncbi:MAG: transposase [Rhodobacter sp.]|nr:transposase [Rhodobacter sp.]
MDGPVHTNGIESFWATFKRAHKDTCHKMSSKHLQRYITEFAAHHNLRELDTLSIVTAVAKGGEGKRLRHRQSVADSGLDSGAPS